MRLSRRVPTKRAMTPQQQKNYLKSRAPNAIHWQTLTLRRPPHKRKTRELIARMIENGLFMLEEDIEIIAQYLNETYVQ